jgi:hypothetical protein
MGATIETDTEMKLETEWRARARMLKTGGSQVTDGRVTQYPCKRKMRSNNFDDGNYLLLRGFSLKWDE